MSGLFKDIRYPSNPATEAYLDKIRQKNRARLEICYYCDNKSEYFDAVDYKIISVCKKHFNFNTSS